MPYRIAAPPEPEPPEAEEPYAAVLRAQQRRARAGLVGAALALVAVVGVARVVRSGARTPQRPPEAARLSDARDARDAVTHARTRAAEAQQRFERGLRAAIEADVAPRPDLGPCPERLLSWARLATRTRTRTRESGLPLLIVARTGLGDPLPSRAVAGVLADVARAEAHLLGGRVEEATLDARALDRPELVGYDVVLVTREALAPRALSGRAFVPGTLAGRAYLFDFSSGRVLCAGDVIAQSSPSVGYGVSDPSDTPASLEPASRMADAVQADFRRQIERAVLASMRWRAGPANDAPANDARATARAEPLLGRANDARDALGR